MRDETGASRGAVCELAGKTGFVTRRSVTDSEGVCTFRGLPAGDYRARVVSVGFRPAEVVVSIKSATTLDERVVLHVAGGSTTVEVTATPAC